MLITVAQSAIVILAETSPEYLKVTSVRFPGLQRIILHFCLFSLEK